MIIVPEEVLNEVSATSRNAAYPPLLEGIYATLSLSLGMVICHYAPCTVNSLLIP
jgi:hypothetical protein